jgi:hypothetical protein
MHFCRRAGTTQPTRARKGAAPIPIFIFKGGVGVVARALLVALPRPAGRVVRCVRTWC